MQKNSISPAQIFKSIVLNNNLIKELVFREVIGRYRGSMMGILWSFLQPLFMLSVYTFVFSVVFKARWGTGGASKSEFALILFSGLMVFNLFSECFNRAPLLITSNVNYVKKVVFPLEIMPFVGLGSAIFHFCINLLVWLFAYGFFYGVPHWTVLLLPVFVMPLIFIILGCSWILSSICVYLRDISQVTSMVTTILMFVSPIFYPIEALPEKYQFYLLFNPLAPTIEDVRQLLFWGAVPNALGYLWHFMASFLFALAGFVIFQKIRKGFADVI